MSWQTMGAVQMHSRYRQDDPANFAPFKIMLALAWFADADGTVGVAGDPRKCVGQRAIAARAGVHRNTVGNWLPQMIAEGELEIVATGGHGRGSWTQYRILLASDPDVPIHAETPQAIDVPISLMPLIEKMAHQIEEMAQQLAQAPPETAQGNGTNGTSHGMCQIHDPDPDPPDPDPDPPQPPPPAPPSANGRGGSSRDGSHRKTVFAALKAAGIVEPARSQLARLPHVTADYVTAHAQTAASTGQAIYRIEHGWPLPRADTEPVCPDCGEKLVGGDCLFCSGVLTR